MDPLPRDTHEDPLFINGIDETHRPSPFAFLGCLAASLGGPRIWRRNRFALSIGLMTSNRCTLTLLTTTNPSQPHRAGRMQPSLAQRAANH